MAIKRLESKGLEKATEIYANREERVKELRSQGKKVIGYLCSFAPLEILWAAGLVPYRIMGRLKEPFSDADRYIESCHCPMIRNCFGMAMRGEYDFLDGIVIPHACDTVHRIYGLWKYYLNPPYSCCVNAPHTTSSSSRRFFKRELIMFKESLEQLIDHEITNQSLNEAITLYNENRDLVKRLYELRKENPPLLSGTEMMKVLIAGSSIPPEEFNALLKEVEKDAKERPEPPVKNRVRLLIYGSIIDDVTLFKLIEECGGNVVVDDTCIGTKSYWNNVEGNGDIFDALTTSYFEKFTCPRTYSNSRADRFQYIVELARDFKADGVICYVLRFCDPYILDVPDVRDWLAKAGLPMLHIEDDYSLASIESLRTRIQAFVETLL
ncbi:2-hydroxyacyl-CoA dehydratase subunit D [Chloroflexota bacterium]